jgi:tRNA G46 methylase TrmB
LVKMSSNKSRIGAWEDSSVDRTAKPDAHRKRTRNVALCAVGVTVLVGGGALFGAGDSLDNEALRLFSVTELGPGMDVAEIGAGKGELSLIAARRVGPSGHVWATEVDQGRIREIRRQAEKAGLKNLMVLEGGETDSNLPRVPRQY